MISGQMLSSRRQRWTAVLSLAFVWGGLWAVVWHTPTGQETAPVKQGTSDINLYRAVAQRVNRGEGYYDAMGDELRTRGYPTRSAFNWRVPVPFWLFSWLPQLIWAKAILAGLALLLLVGAAIILLRAGGWTGGLLGALAVSGGVLPCFLGDLYVNPLIWTSTLIGLSLCAVATERWGWAILFGLLAALFRELAIGYCLVLALFAWRDGRRAETWGWLAAFAAFAAYIGWHVRVVNHLDAAHVDSFDTSSWWHLKSPLFWLQAAQMNGFLLLLPVWCSFVYLSAALAGLSSAPRPWGPRACWATWGYLAGFLFVGKDVNDYWGQLITINLAFGLGCLPLAGRRVLDWIEAGTEPAAGKVDGTR